MLPRTILTIEQLKQKAKEGYLIAVLQRIEHAGTMAYFVDAASYLNALAHIGLTEEVAYGVIGIEYASKSFHVTDVLMQAPKEAEEEAAKAI